MVTTNELVPTLPLGICNWHAHWASWQRWREINTQYSSIMFKPYQAIIHCLHSHKAGNIFWNLFVIIGVNCWEKNPIASIYDAIECHTTHWREVNTGSKAWCCQATSHQLSQCWPSFWITIRINRFIYHIDGLVQDCSNSIANKLDQSIKKFISASLLFDRFMKDVRIGLLQLNIIYEGQ